MTIKLLTTREAAELLGVSTRTIARRYQEGAFPNAHRTGQNFNSPLRIPQEDIDAFIASTQKGRKDNADQKNETASG